MQPSDDKGLQIKPEAAVVGGGNEKLFEGGVLPEKFVPHIGAAFKGLLLQAGAEGRGNVCFFRSVFQHELQRVFNNAVQGAAPAGMGGADNPVAGVIKQNRAAVGRAKSENNAGNICYHAVGKLLPTFGLTDKNGMVCRSLANDSQTFKRQVIMCGGQSKVLSTFSLSSSLLMLPFRLAYLPAETPP